MLDLAWHWQLLAAAAFVSAVMIAMWAIQLRTKNAGIVDAAWTAAIGVMGVFFAFTSGGPVARAVLLAVFIGIWSLRLSVYLFGRVVGHEEDGRYAKLREEWGDQVNSQMFWFFQFQAVAALLFASVILIAARRTGPLDGVDLVGGIVWLAGVVGVAVSDWQLQQFKQRDDVQGQTCRDGLWRYSRHPNYFFEWVHWLSYPILAIGAPLWWLTPIVPLSLLYVLLFVTGIPPTERRALQSRGDDYRRYQETTSPFIPWFPKESGS